MIDYQEYNFNGLKHLAKMNNCKVASKRNVKLFTKASVKDENMIFYLIKFIIDRVVVKYKSQYNNSHKEEMNILIIKPILKDVFENDFIKLANDEEKMTKLCIDK